MIKGSDMKAGKYTTYETSQDTELKWLTVKWKRPLNLEKLGESDSSMSLKLGYGESQKYMMFMTYGIFENSEDQDQEKLWGDNEIKDSKGNKGGNEIQFLEPFEIKNEDLEVKSGSNSGFSMHFLTISMLFYLYLGIF